MRKNYLVNKVVCAALLGAALMGLTACGTGSATETVDSGEVQEEAADGAGTEEVTDEKEAVDTEEVTDTKEAAETEGAAAEEVKLEIGETVDKGLWTQTTVYPDNIDDTFVIDVMLPDDYDETISYPVVYLTDCYWRRENYGEIKDLYESGKTKEFILIGIGYPDDYDFDVIRMRDLVEEPDKFLNLIITGVLPYAEGNYNIDASDRTFCGASNGGYFMLYSLFRSGDITQDVFKNYVLASAVLTNESNGKGIKDFETKYFENHDDLKANVYMTVGADEEVPYMIRPNERFVKRMQERNCPSLNLVYESYEGKEHYTVWVPSLLTGLEMYLAK